ncbi:tumor necrosis factor receptor type 1-associated DEATH domain protein [Pristis pectinata]|uniref:tumor necrosis factor receptor type 1-associated DEATH domain protein n=1 Tax=Pristis pectinata TaxID=685728 RepID=UPI00223D73DC|nr:tumor necrosis factor receptor type 1-associated DEATH domain protein [Pristis pectinata]XP_051884497.1 tumor necrosis factor receptor type 1-associated DEATH domain protein [Pristis pectinata]XP_051884498.1 tumor necrosis factor receptor type 1-associated DEATH domain protein [Pristis pectinata]XP_051884499.1 tumor necrosis factor receptor type 1-associated DEATH domain protein [Pristis pectinata]XP_051884500.1 tumor necrosis factor receptor type 1-associated DEATH domain protein [Pristis p
MDPVSPCWVGSVFLFIRSDKVDLSDLYRDPQMQLKIYKALKLSLADATGSGGGYEILKVYGSVFGLQLKFTEEVKCRKFLHSYERGSLQEALVYHFQTQSIPSTAFTMELKAGPVTLDDILNKPDSCIKHIKANEPNHLRDDDVTRLEEDIRQLVLEYSSICQGSSIQCDTASEVHSVPESLSPSSPPSIASLTSTQTNGSPLPSTDTFEFQGVFFGDRVLSGQDHDNFAKSVGRNWKQVGRVLQKNCRGLRDPAIDNIAFEYEREGLYEQAYQMLLKFIQCEGKKATMSRLIRALEKSELIGVADQLLNNT